MTKRRMAQAELKDPERQYIKGPGLVEDGTDMRHLRGFRGSSIKGSWNRCRNSAAYNKGWDRIFGKGDK